VLSYIFLKVQKLEEERGKRKEERGKRKEERGKRKEDGFFKYRGVPQPYRCYTDVIPLLYCCLLFWVLFWFYSV